MKRKVPSYTQQDKERVLKKKKKFIRRINSREVKNQGRLDLAFVKKALREKRESVEIPPNIFMSMTPTIQEYWSIKSKNLQKMVFFQIGGFFEMFDIDADIAQRVGFEAYRSKLFGDMLKAGFPTHSLDKWGKEFLSLGYSIVVVQEVGKENKRSIRKVVRRITPGTIDDPILTSYSNETSKIMSIVENKQDNGKIEFGICIVECLENRIILVRLENETDERTKFETILYEYYPQEILFIHGYLQQKSYGMIQTLGKVVKNIIVRDKKVGFPDYFAKYHNQFKGNQKSRLLLESYKDSKIMSFAIGGCYDYLLKLGRESVFLKASNIQNHNDKQEDRMNLSGSVIKNLNLFSSLESISSLYSFFTPPLTKSGVETLKEWIRRPLSRKSLIRRRQEAVEELQQVCKSEGSSLKKDFDISTIGNKSLSSEMEFLNTIWKKDKKDTEFYLGITEHEYQKWIRKWILVISGFEKLAKFLFKYQRTFTRSIILKRVFEERRINNFLKVLQQFLDYIPMFKKYLGGEDYTEIIMTIDQYKDLHVKLEEIKQEKKKLLKYYIQKLKYKKIYYHEPKKRSNAKSISFNLKIEDSSKLKMEIAKAGLQKENKNKKDGLFTSNHIEDLKRKIENFEKERIEFLINFLLWEIEVMYKEENVCQFHDMTKSFSLFDCLLSYVNTIEDNDSPEYRLVRPKFNNDKKKARVIYLNNFYHPILKIVFDRLNETSFGLKKVVVKNNFALGSLTEPDCSIISGPNMGGKTTFLRAVAVIIVLAQMGMHVPAEDMVFSIVDNIFTRIGANDRICAGESTFAVEMIETSSILRKAKENSLVILDELGRGTSVKEGEAIAYATIRYLCEKTKCFVLFSTHLHNVVTSLQNCIYCKFHYLGYKSEKREIILTHELKLGTSHSFGLEIAKKAGIPQNIIDRARKKISEKMDDSREYALLEKYDIGKLEIYKTISDGIINMSNDEIRRLDKDIHKEFSEYD